MTTREKVIAAAKECGAYRYINRAARDEPTHTFTVEQLERFYAIAYEAGRQAERVVTIQDDGDLRFIKRVLAGESPIKEDKAECIRLIHNIRTRARRTK